MDVENGNFRRRKKRRPKLSVRKKALPLAKEFASTTTIHGVSYITSRDHPKVGRVLWAVVVVLAILCTTFQMVSLYNQWKIKPVITSLETVSLPMNNIEFPAFTICPQGYVADIMDHVLVLQFKEHIKNKIRNGEIRPKRSTQPGQSSTPDNSSDDYWNMTRNDMQDLVKDFLKNAYPGAKGNPRKIATLLISDEPEKVVKNEAVLIPNNDDKECNETNLEQIVNDLNKELNMKSCAPGFVTVDKTKCLSETEMSYELASQQCRDMMDGQVLELNSDDDLKTLEKILGNELIDIHT